MKLVECVSTGSKLPEAVATEVDELYKTLPAGCEYRTKSFTPEAIQFEPGERAEVSIITTNSVDKSNEVLLPHAIDFDAYRKNPVVLWDHKKDHPPVGTCQWIKVHGDDTVRAKTLYPERQGDDDPERPWYIDEVWNMVRSDVLRAKSISFIPRKPLRDANPDELELHPEWAGAGVWDDVLMIEYSVCPIGMNNDSVVEAIAKGMNPEALKALGIDVPSFPAPHTDIVPTKVEYTKEQIVAIVQAHCQALKKRKKKRVNHDEVFARAIDKVVLDVDRIARMAQQMYRNRGRV